MNQKKLRLKICNSIEFNTFLKPVLTRSVKNSSCLLVFFQSHNQAVSLLQSRLPFPSAYLDLIVSLLLVQKYLIKKKKKKKKKKNGKHCLIWVYMVFKAYLSELPMTKIEISMKLECFTCNLA